MSVNERLDELNKKWEAVIRQLQDISHKMDELNHKLGLKLHSGDYTHGEGHK